MKQALAITGVAAAATLTLGGLMVAMPEPAMAKGHRHARPAAPRAHRHAKHHRHARPAAARTHRQVKHHNPAGQARRNHHVVNVTGSGAVFAPGYGRAPGGLTIRF